MRGDARYPEDTRRVLLLFSKPAQDIHRISSNIGDHSLAQGRLSKRQGAAQIVQTLSNRLQVREQLNEIYMQNIAGDQYTQGLED